MKLEKDKVKTLIDQAMSGLESSGRKLKERGERYRRRLQRSSSYLSFSILTKALINVLKIKNSSVSKGYFTPQATNEIKSNDAETQATHTSLDNIQSMIEK